MWVSATYLQEAIALLEEEMVINQLLLHFLCHTGEGVELALEFTLQAGECAGNLVLHLLVLCLSQARVEGVTLHGTTASHSCGNDVLAL